MAVAREREASLLADAASAILAGQSVTAQLESIGNRVARATGASRARVVLEPVPAQGPGEIALPLRARTRSAWLYVSTDTSWPVRDLERISDPLGRLIDVAVERERVAEREAETEAGRRAEVARTAILHAISHDLRSPLTAITTAGSALRAADITNDERSELIEVIEDEGARLAKLVDDLLDLSKIQAGAVSPQADWCDLHDAVASAAAHLRHGSPDRVLATSRPPAGPGRRLAARAGVLEPDRERRQVLAAALAGSYHSAGSARDASRCG